MLLKDHLTFKKYCHHQHHQHHHHYHHHDHHDIHYHHYFHHHHHHHHHHSGGLFSTYYGIPFSRIPEQIAVASASGQIFTTASAHGLSYGSLIKVVKSSGSFTLGSVWLVLGSNLGSTTFSVSLKSSNNFPNEISVVSAVSGVTFAQVPIQISPKIIDSYPKMGLGSIFDYLPDSAYIFGMGVRWSGFVRVPTRSEITFSFSTANSGSPSVAREKLNFYISGNALISAWYSTASMITTFTGLTGAHYSIEIEYGSTFPLGIQCILYWKWDALAYSQISPLYLLKANEGPSKYSTIVLPSFVVPQKSVLNGPQSVATAGVASFFTVSTFDRFQNPAALSSASEISSVYVLFVERIF
jgi:hypothetical protein